MSHHMSTEERIKIETLLDLGTSKKQIALYLVSERKGHFLQKN